MDNGPSTWEVVGGVGKGGIVVRVGRELSSRAEAERLSTGAMIVQEELVGDRLQYRLVSGTGPPTGWVTTDVPGKKLIVQKKFTVCETTSPEMPAVPSPPEKPSVGIATFALG